MAVPYFFFMGLILFSTQRPALAQPELQQDSCSPFVSCESCSNATDCGWCGTFVFANKNKKQFTCKVGVPEGPIIGNCTIFWIFNTSDCSDPSAPTPIVRTRDINLNIIGASLVSLCGVVALICITVFYARRRGYLICKTSSTDEELVNLTKHGPT